MRLNNIQWMNEWLLTIAEDNWTMNWHWKWRNNATTAENGEEQKFNWSQVVALLQFPSVDERFGAKCFHSLLMCQQSELGLKQTSSLLFCFFGFHRCVQQLPPTSSQRRCGSNPTSSCSITASNPPKIHQKSTKNPPKVHPISPFSSPISIKLNQNSYLT